MPARLARFGAAAAAALLLVAASTREASASILYNMTNVNAGLVTGGLGDGPVYATVLAEDHADNASIAAGSVRFTFAVNAAVAPAGSKIGEFGFNANVAVPLANINVSALSGWTSEAPASMDGFGSFTGGAVENGAADRVTSGVVTVSGLALSNLAPNAGGGEGSGTVAIHFFAPTVTGYIADGPAGVPEPSSLLLLGGLVAGLGGFSKLRRLTGQSSTPVV